MRNESEKESRKGKIEKDGKKSRKIWGKGRGREKKTILRCLFPLKANFSRTK